MQLGNVSVEDILKGMLLEIMCFLQKIRGFELTSKLLNCVFPEGKVSFKIPGAC